MKSPPILQFTIFASTIFVGLYPQSASSSSWCGTRNVWSSEGSYQSIDPEYWDQIPFKVDAVSEFVGVPNGCECVNDIQSNEECTVFKCNQGCNLNRGTCDRHCCSDPDCTPGEIEQFRGAGECLPEPASFRVEKCQELGTLEQVNAKFRMQVSISDDPLDRILCVSIDNNPIKGAYYNTPWEILGTPEVLDDPRFRAEFDSFESAQASLPSLGSNFGYETGDAILAARIVGTIGEESILEPFASGLLPFPQAGPGGECLDTTFAQLSANDASSTCTRVIRQPAAACENGTMLSTSIYQEQMVIGASPRASRSVPSSFKPIALGSVRYLDEASGEWYRVLPGGREVTGSPTASPVVPTNTTRRLATEHDAVDPTRRALQDELLVDTAWDSATQTCRGAVVGVAYTLDMEPDGVVASASVDLIVSNITVQQENSSDALSVQQSFSIAFRSTTPGNETGIHRTVSGNPGYIKGLPLLSGQPVVRNPGDPSEKEAVLMNLEGLGLPGPQGSKGNCFDDSAAHWWEGVQSDRGYTRKKVNFGINMHTSCSVEMSYDEFVNLHADWCEDFTSLPSFNITDGLVGMYGNADPLKPEEWLSVSSDVSSLLPTSFSTVAGDFRCLNVANEMRLQVLWTNTGEKLNPQPMVLAVRVSYAQVDWTWQLPPGSNRKQKFLISRTVSFVEYTATAEETYKPQVPPLLPAIPTDVFYPFDIRTSQATKTTTTISAFFSVLLLLFLNY